MRPASTNREGVVNAGRRRTTPIADKFRHLTVVRAVDAARRRQRPLSRRIPRSGAVRGDALRVLAAAWRSQDRQMTNGGARAAR
jgi:hypothetical protein